MRLTIRSGPVAPIPARSLPTLAVQARERLARYLPWEFPSEAMALPLRAYDRRTADMLTRYARHARNRPGVAMLTIVSLLASPTAPLVAAQAPPAARPAAAAVPPTELEDWPRAYLTPAARRSRSISRRSRAGPIRSMPSSTRRCPTRRRAPRSPRSAPSRWNPIPASPWTSGS